MFKFIFRFAKILIGLLINFHWTFRLASENNSKSFYVVIISAKIVPFKYLGSSRINPGAGLFNILIEGFVRLFEVMLVKG